MKKAAILASILLLMGVTVHAELDYHWEEGKFWYENGVRQGVYGDKKNITDTIYGYERGREIYDPGTGAWFWLDARYDGAKACDKEVWMPYVYQNEDPGSTEGKWVRYQFDGIMIKGWYWADANIYPEQAGKRYYYDLQTGAMTKGTRTINGVTYHFDELDGHLLDNSLEDKIIDLEALPPEQYWYGSVPAVQSVLGLHGQEKTQAEIITEMYHEEGDLTEFERSAIVLNRYIFNQPVPGPADPGYRVQKLDIHTGYRDLYLQRELFEERVLRDLKTNDPIFVNISLSGLYPGEFKDNAGRTMLVVGYQKDLTDNRIRYFYINDPAIGISQVVPVTLWSLMTDVSDLTEAAYIW